MTTFIIKGGITMGSTNRAVSKQYMEKIIGVRNNIWWLGCGCMYS